MSRTPILSITKKDFMIKTFRSGGPGGQHQNKVETGVRIIHKETGMFGESRTEKSQYRNKVLAFQRLVNKPEFKQWLINKSKEIIDHQNIDDIVARQLAPENIKIEISIDGKWQQVDDIREKV